MHILGESCKQARPWGGATGAVAPGSKFFGVVVVASPPPSLCCHFLWLHYCFFPLPSSVPPPSPVSTRLLPDLHYL